jgi:2-polyprenyl-3-methyl-5-hydroxy-6-metoxy-1,4-benzoquinol methylase
MTAPAYPDGSAFEAVPCEICGDDRRRLITKHADLLLGGDRMYSMHECGGCGAVYQHPRPTSAAMGTFYPAEYEPYTRGVHTEHWLRQLDRRYGLRKRCHTVTRHMSGGCLLDVGCATGSFLSEMKRQPGWTVMGIEPSPVAARYVRDQVGVDVVQGVLNEAPFAPASFDAITMWDVLEHVYDPLTVLSQVARLLKPGGVFVVNHPNLDSIDRRLFGAFWAGYELPRHLYLFPADLLRRLLAEYGLREVEQRCLYGSHAASATSVWFMAAAYGGRGRASRAVRRVVGSKLCRLVAMPYFQMIDRRGLGSNVTVVFKRTG